MNDQQQHPENDRLAELLSECTDGRLTAEQGAELADLLRDDPAARRRYIRYMMTDALLESELHVEHAVLDPGALGTRAGEAASVSASESEIPVARPIRLADHADSEPVAPRSSDSGWWRYAVAAAVAVVTSVAVTMLVTSNRSASDAEVDPVQVAQERAGAPVAIVTDLSSADWDASLSPEIGTQVPRGTMRLNAGRAQMMFNSGAVVDVIGPAEFELLGESGATLKRGKMMAWVPPRAQGFTVDVPGMKLVDLGTQFGVHVLANDVVEVHVLQGVIEAHPQLGVGGAAPKAMELTEQQAIRFDTRTGIVEKVAIERVRFNRRPVVSGTATVVDLLDVIAWGDGSGEAHSRGVEPHTGEKATKWYHDYDVTGTPVYKRIDWSDVIDGVFVPDKGDVTLNSAGDRFDGFPNTDRKFISPIWTHRPRKDVGDVPIDFKSLPQEKRNWIREAGPSTRYNPEGRGMLALHANAGVTFDLDVVRKRYPDHRIVRFHATTGNIQGPGGGSRSPQLADVWVFTGGELRFNRNRINSNHGTFEVDIEIRPDTRFLTLVATDSSNGYNNDQIVFGDPVIELEPR